MAWRKWEIVNGPVAASAHTLPPYRTAPPFEIGFSVSPRHSEIGFWIFGAPVLAFEVSYERTYRRVFLGILCLCASATQDL